MSDFAFSQLFIMFEILGQVSLIQNKDKFEFNKVIESEYWWYSVLNPKSWRDQPSFSTILIVRVSFNSILSNLLEIDVWQVLKICMLFWPVC